MNLSKLNGKIAERGIKKKLIAKELGISVQALRKKLNGETKISTDDAIKFCEVLDIANTEEKCEIFLQKQSHF